MNSTITSKGRTTIPAEVRKALGLETSNVLEWKVENGRAVVVPLRKNSFLSRQGQLKAGAGDIEADISKARELTPSVDLDETPGRGVSHCHRFPDNRRRLARECAKLDPAEEKALAEEGMAGAIPGMS